MRPVHPFVAAAGALLVFVTGYSIGASGDNKDPFLNTKVLASSSGPTVVTGPDADPPPWPGGPAAEAAQAAALAPAAGTPSAMAAAPVQPAAASAAPEAAPRLISSTDAPPADTQRVAPAAASSSSALALNLSSALAPVEHPVAPLPDKDMMTAPETASVAVPADDSQSRIRARRILQKNVTFGTRHDGRPVTIIWDN